MSQEYRDAIEKNNVAIREFRKVQESYRSRDIGDTEFLAGRKAYDAAMVEFDAAFTKEQEVGTDDEEVDESNPHGARCAACGELLVDGLCIDCDDDKNFGAACEAFYA